MFVGRISTHILIAVTVKHFFNTENLPCLDITMVTSYQTAAFITDGINRVNNSIFVSHWFVLIYLVYAYLFGELVRKSSLSLRILQFMLSLTIYVFDRSSKRLRSLRRFISVEFFYCVAIDRTNNQAIVFPLSNLFYFCGRVRSFPLIISTEFFFHNGSITQF